MKEFLLKSKKSNSLFNKQHNIVLLTFDEGYYMQAINLMMSIQHFNTNVSFICICSKISQAIQDELLNENFGLGVLVYRYEINFSLNSKRWKDVMCYRIFSPWLIDEDIEEVCYLDADMLCKGDLSPIFNIKEYLIVMCSEISGNISEPKDLDGNDRVSIYCNSGLTKINLKRFRESYVYEEIRDSFFEKLNKLKCPDQDFLNYCLGEEKVTRINGFTYNFQPYEFFNNQGYYYALENTRILHFSCFRPWDRECKFNDYFELYLKYSYYQPLISIVKHEYKRHKQLAILRPFKKLINSKKTKK